MKRSSFTNTRKPLPRKSKKKVAYAASPEGQEDAAYLDAVRARPCCACGRHGPSEPHHCRDWPDHAEQGIYKRLPGAGMKSDDQDAIPLCGPNGCHRMFHLFRGDFHGAYGKDYLMLPAVRAELEGQRD